DDEYGGRVGPGVAAGACRGGGLGSLDDTGEVDPELRADVRRGIDLDPSLVLLHDPVDGGEAEARALAQFLRGEERIEDPGQDLRGHAGAGVGHGDANVPAR